MPATRVDRHKAEATRRRASSVKRPAARAKPQTGARPTKYLFDDAFIRFANDRDVRPFEKLAGTKPLKLILEAAIASEEADKIISAVAIPSTVLAIGGALAYHKSRDSKPLVAVALGMAGLWPFFHSRTHRTAPSKQQLMDAATLKQKRYVLALLEFLEALGDGSIKAYEKVTPHSRTLSYREIHPSLFRADHALAPIIGGPEYWKCVKAKTSLKHRLPTTELFFEIGDLRAKPYLTGKLLIELPCDKYSEAKQVILNRFPSDRVVEDSINAIEKMRALDAKTYRTAQAKAAKVNGRVDHARTLTMLAEGQLEHFENRLRLVDVEGLA